MGAKYEVFEGEDQQHYWRLVAANGQIIATGAEGYSSEGAALRAVGTVQATTLEIVTADARAQADKAANAAEAQTG